MSLLARLSGRRREIAVRGALGAGRWALARPVLAESVLLSLVGGTLGLGVAVIGLRVLTALPGGHLPRMERVGLDTGGLVFTLSVSGLVALGRQSSAPCIRDCTVESSSSTPNTTRGASTSSRRLGKR